ncbi:MULTISPECIES: RICIN domain-containing protein [Streptomyces]|uniref:RICIN domain-containing protein n=1 Tax=Streptomyces TaxID=1883 RepID=UPI0023DD38CA|nr:RICIN domain-containing protein [Streptomyces sp. FXJ1.172]WEP00616.1 RICIN domain-containing protein [Streptomyces sp. FXJ1.172]
MVEPDQKRPGGPGIPGFAKSFAATSRQPGHESSRAIPKLLLVSAAVAVAIAVTLGAGLLLSTSGKKHNGASGKNHDNQLAADAASSNTKHVSPNPGGQSTAPNHPGDKSPAAPGGITQQPGSGGTAKPAPGGGGTPKSAPRTENPHTTTASLPTHPIVGIGSNRCIDIPNGNVSSGAQLQIWDCSGAGWQKWSFPSDGTIRSEGACMQLAGGSTDDGTAIVMAQCDGTAAQRFTLNSSNDLVSLDANKCVDVTDKATDDGSLLQLWDCAGTKNQKWAMGQ